MTLGVNSNLKNLRKQIAKGLVNMKKELFEQAMEYIDDEIVEEVMERHISKKQVQKKIPRRQIKTKAFAIAASLLLMVGIWGICQRYLFIGGNTNQSIEVSQAPTILREEEKLPSSIKYEDLKLAEVTENIDNIEDISNISILWDMTLAEFKESMLADSQSIVEATVKKAYVKEYEYKVEEDKFEKNRTRTRKAYTIIYEVEIDHVWYGNYKKGDKVIIEEESVACFSTLSSYLEIGKSYVLPLYEGNDNIHILSGEKLLSGNIKKQSRMGIIYHPFHKQIEITLDHKYIAGSDWTVLSKEKNKAEVEMDKKENDMVEKFYLYTEDTFGDYMEKIKKRYFIDK